MIWNRWRTRIRRTYYAAFSFSLVLCCILETVKTYNFSGHGQLLVEQHTCLFRQRLASPLKQTHCGYASSIRQYWTSADAWVQCFSRFKRKPHTSGFQNFLPSVRFNIFLIFTRNNTTGENVHSWTIIIRDNNKIYGCKIFHVYCSGHQLNSFLSRFFVLNYCHTYNVFSTTLFTSEKYYNIIIIIQRYSVIICTLLTLIRLYFD